MKDLTPEEETMPLNASLALEAVLLFHSGSPWDEPKRRRWQEICREVLKDPKFEDYHYRRGISNPAEFDATTKTLCDLVRAALGKLQPKKDTHL